MVDREDALSQVLSYIESTLIPTMVQLQSMKSSDLEAQQIEMPDERITQERAMEYIEKLGLALLQHMEKNNNNNPYMVSFQFMYMQMGYVLNNIIFT